MEEKLGAGSSAADGGSSQEGRSASVCLWEEEEFCMDNLDRLKWRMERRVYNASNTHSSLFINTPVTSSTSLQALGVGAEIFSSSRVRAFPPTTH